MMCNLGESGNKENIETLRAEGVQTDQFGDKPSD